MKREEKYKIQRDKNHVHPSYLQEIIQMMSLM